MRVAIFIFINTFLCFCCFAQEKQKSVFNSDSVDYFNQGCAMPEYKLKKGKIVRRNKGNDYTLVDTSGIIIYTKANYHYNVLLKGLGSNNLTDGYFSKGYCGKIYFLDYSNIKEQFKDYPGFYHALKRIDKKDYFKVSGPSGVTTVNGLYKKFVK